ncbi:MAG: efflux RND transporter periplasmic adaptor subunit [Bradyrhizobiaceae bacterium]|nr:efflux RND transporter periplasmic adaptor subunit [Bradyrhizobiaceae bacterium]
MTFRYMAITTAAVVLLTSCGSNNNPSDLKQSPKEQLDAYRAQRAQLDEKIKKLEAALGSTSTNGNKAHVTTITTTKAPFDHFVVVKGTVDSKSSVVVAAKMAGQLVSLNVRDGQQVSKGQVLAEIDAELIKRGMDEVTTQLDFARSLFHKQERIYQQKAGSEIQYLQAKTNMEALEKKLETLKEQLSLTIIKAPTSGFVDNVQPTAGEVVMAGVPMMTIVNTSNMEVVSDVSEKYVSSISVGDRVKIAFPELGDTVLTTVATISKGINPVSRTFRVTIPLRSVPAGLKPNSTCDLSITDVTVQNAVTVPLESIVRHGSEEFVFVIEDGVARKKTIKTNLVSGASVEVVSGLGANEQVVVRGATNLTDGQRVVVVP